MINKNEYFDSYLSQQRLEGIAFDPLGAKKKVKPDKGNLRINTGTHGELLDDRGERVRDHGELIDDRGEWGRDHGELIGDRGEWVRDHGELIGDRGELIDDRGEWVRTRRPNQRGPPVNTGDCRAVGKNGKN